MAATAGVVMVAVVLVGALRAAAVRVVAEMEGAVRVAVVMAAAVWGQPTARRMAMWKAQLMVSP